MKVIILAGGSGTRLWPLSRAKLPKQFMNINGKGSLIMRTVNNSLKITNEENIFITSNEDYKFQIIKEIEKTCSKIKNNIISEPSRRNTAPAITLSINYLLNHSSDEEEIVFVSASDHIIEPFDDFVTIIKEAEKIAKQGYIVTFGVKPSYPETGYGYICQGKEIEKTKGYTIHSFVEKPNKETAKEYIEKGYLWNSGMFMFKIKTIKEELKKYSGEIYKMFGLSDEKAIKNYEKLPKISIDYAIMEKTNKKAVIPSDINWRDLGSWDSVYDFLEKDKDKNSAIGNVFLNDSSRNLVIGSEKKLIALTHLNDLIIVDTPDAILITKRGETQNVKKIVEYLKEKNDEKAIEHTTVYRPWGKYTVLEQKKGYKIKVIEVYPMQKLSLQMHNNRSEHWIVVKGIARVTIGEEKKEVKINESVYVPVKTKHRLENPSEEVLKIIEIQNGDYVEEDDIIRFNDIYDRETSKNSSEKKN